MERAARAASLRPPATASQPLPVTASRQRRRNTPRWAAHSPTRDRPIDSSSSDLVYTTGNKNNSSSGSANNNNDSTKSRHDSVSPSIGTHCFSSSLPSTPDPDSKVDVDFSSLNHERFKAMLEAASGCSSSQDTVSTTPTAHRSSYRRSTDTSDACVGGGTVETASSVSGTKLERSTSLVDLMLRRERKRIESEEEQYQSLQFALTGLVLRFVIILRR